MIPAQQGRLHTGLFVCFLLFLFSSAFSIALSQFTFGLSLFLFIIIAIRERYNPFAGVLKWFYLAASVYIGWMIFACATGGTFPHSLNTMREEWLFAIIPVGIYLIQSRKDNLPWMMGALAGGLLAVTLFSLAAWWLRSEFGWEIGRVMISEGALRMRGNFSHALTFGNYTATATLFLLGYVLTRGDVLKSKYRVFIFVSGLAGLVGVLLANSRGPIICVAVGLIIALFFLRGRNLIIGMAVLILSATAFLSVESWRDRFSVSENNTGIERNWKTEWQGSRRFIWENSIEIIRRHPLHGVGPGNFGREYVAVVGEDKLKRWYRYGHAHNDLLNIAAQAGIPGAVIFVGLWLTVFGYLGTGLRRINLYSREHRLMVAAFVGGLVFAGTSLTEATFVDEEVKALLLFVWAAGLSGWYNKRTDSPSE